MPIWDTEWSSPMLIELEHARAYQPFFDYLTGALGYTEFQGPQVVSPLIGNGVMSLAYLLTMNPLGAVLSHIAMHIAAVLHGISTTIQLPPHY
jgi:hypothetical protein